MGTEIAEFTTIIDPISERESTRGVEVWNDFLRGLTTAFFQKDDSISYAKKLIDYAGGGNKYLLAIVEKVLTRTMVVSKNEGINRLSEVFLDTDQWLNVPREGIEVWREKIFQEFVDKYRPDGAEAVDNPKVSMRDVQAALGLLWGLTARPNDFGKLAFTNSDELRNQAYDFLGLVPS